MLYSGAAPTLGQYRINRDCKHMPTCAGCHRRITGSYITALGRSWHQRCFVCAGCGQSIAQQRFLEHQGEPYHANCYHQRFSPRCSGCGQINASLARGARMWVCPECGATHDRDINAAINVKAVGQAVLALGEDVSLLSKFGISSPR